MIFLTLLKEIRQRFLERDLTTSTPRFIPQAPFWLFTTWRHDKWREVIGADQGWFPRKFTVSQRHIYSLEPLGTDTSLTKFSYIFFKEKPLWYGLSLIGATDTKYRPQRAHSYKLNLFITDTAVIRWICTGWILSGWWAMQGDFKSPVTVYQTTICERCTEEHNRLNFKGWITTDSIKIFSITFCTPVTIYCTCKIAKDAFRIVLYVTTFCLQHCAVARFVLKQWFVYDCTYFVVDTYNVVC